MLKKFFSLVADPFGHLVLQQASSVYMEFSGDCRFMNTIFSTEQRGRANRFVTVLILTLAWVGSAHAQTFTQQTNLLNNTNFRSGVSMGIADMNGDGLDDIIRLNTLEVYLSNIRRQPTQHSVILITALSPVGRSGVCASVMLMAMATTIWLLVELTIISSC